MAIKGLITMSQKEVLKLQIMENLKNEKISQIQASKILKISCRQIRRLIKKYKRDGAESLISKKRGQPSNNRICEAVKENILAITKEKYLDFGPTFLGEKLLENHEIKISKESLRQLMISANIWQAKRAKKARIHQMRERRKCFGELVQIDGSLHDWFEGRNDKCCLLVFIDDATGKLVNLRFEQSETTAGYFKATKEYITKYGLPMAFYSDKHSIFRVNMPNCDNETQFGRVLKKLGIEIICANSPQAKGRVERANGILQDRLIKEMRLQKINDIEAANSYLPKFIEQYNKKFAVKPENSADAHIQLVGNENLNLIFSFKENRVLSKNLELSYYNTIYQIKTKNNGYRLRHANVDIYEDLQGKVTIKYKEKTLDFSSYKRAQKTAIIAESKNLNNKLDSIEKNRYAIPHKPAVDHPWRQHKVMRENRI